MAQGARQETSSSSILWPDLSFGGSLSYDFIVIGAGHNGLACAAYLARAGAGWWCWSEAPA